jgi:deazaflavin-dependent oxidoreductase (nitroreductase family)
MLPPELAEASVCYLETTGRTSGRPRVIEIWFAATERTLYLLAGDRERAHWVRNLAAEPRARVRIAGVSFDVTAEFIEGSPEAEVARRLLATRYQGWHDGAPLSRWARTSLPVALRLDAEALDRASRAEATGGSSHGRADDEVAAS